jgi:hypothetical protein
MGYLFEVILLSCLVAIALAVFDASKEAKEEQSRLEKVQNYERFLKLTSVKMKGGKR